MTAMEQMKILKVHCNKCLQKTRHELVAERINHGSETFSNDPHPMYPDFEITWQDTYRMLQCLGCESVTLQNEYWFSEGDGVDEEFYPPRIARKLPDWRDDLPKEWRELLVEVYKALHTDSRRLVMMGARTLVDLYLNEQVGDIGGFAAKLKKLKEDHLISTPAKDILEAALDVGHAVSHRAHKPSPKEVNQVIDIVENLLHQHTLVNTSEELRASTPRRG